MGLDSTSVRISMRSEKILTKLDFKSVWISHGFGFHMGLEFFISHRFGFHISLKFSKSVRISHGFGIFHMGLDFK